LVQVLRRRAALSERRRYYRDEFREATRSPPALTIHRIELYETYYGTHGVSVTGAVMNCATLSKARAVAVSLRKHLALWKPPA